MRELVIDKSKYDQSYLGSAADKRHVSWVMERVREIISARYKLSRLMTIVGLAVLDVGKVGGLMRGELEWLFGSIHSSGVDLDEERFDFRDGSMDVVTSIDVIEHLYNPLFHLLECKRVLREGGIMILDTCNDSSLIYKVEHILGLKYSGHFHQFSEWDMRCILGRAGFKILEFKKYFRPTSGTIARISRKEMIIVCQK